MLAGTYSSTRGSANPSTSSLRAFTDPFLEVTRRRALPLNFGDGIVHTRRRGLPASPQSLRRQRQASAYPEASDRFRRIARTCRCESALHMAAQLRAYVPLIHADRCEIGARSPLLFRGARAIECD